MQKPATKNGEGQRVRAWCFTYNLSHPDEFKNAHKNAFRGYVDTCLNTLRESLALKLKCSYYVIGEEICPTTGRHHFQGYAFWKGKKAFSVLKSEIPGAHWEAAKGSPKQNYDYCTKDEHFVTYGERPIGNDERSEKAARSKKKRQEQIADDWDAAKKGKFECLQPHHIKAWEYIFAKYGEQAEDRKELCNYWIWGPSGCGKSKVVRDVWGSSFYNKGMNKWWDGYNHEKVVVLEDFAPEHATQLAYRMKIWADHYAFNAEVKGGMLHIRPTIFIVTSQYSIEDAFRECDHETKSAMERRFQELRYNAEVPTMMQELAGRTATALVRHNAMIQCSSSSDPNNVVVDADEVEVESLVSTEILTDEYESAEEEDS